MRKEREDLFLKYNPIQEENEEEEGADRVCLSHSQVSNQFESTRLMLEGGALQVSCKNMAERNEEEKIEQLMKLYMGKEGEELN